MNQQNGADFNDLMFGLYQQRPQLQHEVMESISNASDSGLASSATCTRTDFSPQIIEYGKDFELSCNAIKTTESVFDDTENAAQSLTNMDLSTFDLALEKGYNDQAKIYFDDIISKGEKLKTKYVLPLLDALHQETEELFEFDITRNKELYCSKEFACQLIYMTRKDFKEYLEYMEKNEFRKVIRKLKGKTRQLNEQEKQIKENISTKAKRNNPSLKEETIALIKKFLEQIDHFETDLRRNVHFEAEGATSEENKKDNATGGL